jgi:hypothetical protein
VPIGYEEEAVVFVLELYPVIERAYEVAEVEFAGGTHAAEHAGLRLESFGHQNLRSMP